MSIDLSVIIPVYNVAPYLQACLDSICSQPDCTLEVICVDDGSTDTSPQILQAAAAHDKRIRILTQTNQGPSAARNRGLDLATGRYIFLMDSDDVLAKDALPKLIALADRENLDHIIFCANTFLDNSGGDVPESLFQAELYYHTIKNEALFNRISSGGRLFCGLIESDSFYVSPQARLLRRDLIEANSLRFIEGFIHEDNHFTALALILAQRAILIPDKFCNRRVRGGSTMTAPGALIRHIVGYFGIILRLQVDFERLKGNDPVLEAAMRSFIETLLYVGSEILFRTKQDEGAAILLEKLSPVCSPEELRALRWSLLPALNILRRSAEAVKRNYNKRLSVRIKRFLRIKKD